VTGAWSVWLVVRNNHWNWPIGVANSASFVALFWSARLHFDMGLNVFYVVSGLWGWWIWLYGGARHTEKPIGSVGLLEAGAVAAAGLALTLVMWHGGILLDDAAPFFDALTTGISVVAQWLLMRRLIQNWYAWIAVDLIYVPLYLSRGLPLTAALYAIFLLLCLRGLVDWRALVRRQGGATQALEGTA
jgi:nicotinamide mononucleotide transporter